MNLRRRQLGVAAAACLTSPFWSAPAAAQSFKPARPVRIIVPYVPGGVPDVLARQIAKQLGTLWNQSVFVENKPGAAGAIGAETLARSPGDGLTFMVADDGALVSAPLLKIKPSYDPQTDIVPIGTAGASPYVIIGAPGSPPLVQLIANARAAPGAVTFASNGIGGPHHLLWEKWQEELGIRLNQVPYNGTLPALQDVAAGLVHLMAATPSSAQGLIQAGRVKPLAAAASRRFDFLPDTLSTTELGLPKLQGEAWYGFMAPGSMPGDLIERVGTDLRTVLRSKDFMKSLDDRHNLSLVLDAKQTAERMANQRVEAKALLKRSGVAPS